MKIIIFLTCLYSMLLFSSSTKANQINKWIDEQGITHYEKEETPEFLINDKGYSTSFEKLNNKVAEIVAKKKNIDEFQKYLTPLHKGMSTQEVFNAWGKDLKSGGYEQEGITLQTVKSFTFKIGVTLFFKNDKLRSWQISE